MTREQALIKAFEDSGHDKLGVDEGRNAELRQAAYERWFGEAARVYHPMMEPCYHVDVMIHESMVGDEPITRLITCGMSNYPMFVPAEYQTEVPAHRELMMYVKGHLGEEERWELDAIRFLAHLPFLMNSFFDVGHTIPAGPTPEHTVEPGSEMVAFFLTPPLCEPEDVCQGIELADGSLASLLVVDFLSAAELDLKLEHGIRAIGELFNKNDHQPFIRKHGYSLS
jgi:hypothetical protein